MDTVTIDGTGHHLSAISIVFNARRLQVGGPGVARSIFIWILDRGEGPSCELAELLGSAELVESHGISSDLTLLGEVIFDRADDRLVRLGPIFPQLCLDLVDKLHVTLIDVLVLGLLGLDLRAESQEEFVRLVVFLPEGVEALKAIPFVVGVPHGVVGRGVLLHILLFRLSISDL